MKITYQLKLKYQKPLLEKINKMNNNIKLLKKKISMSNKNSYYILEKTKKISITKKMKKTNQVFQVPFS